MDKVIVNRYPVLFRLFSRSGGIVSPVVFSSGPQYTLGVWYNATHREGFMVHDCESCPGEDCVCGFHAFSRVAPMEYMYTRCTNRLAGRFSIGTVEIGGKVVVHQWGVRAKRMRVVRLYDDFGIAIRACRHLQNVWRKFADDLGIDQSLDFAHISRPSLSYVAHLREKFSNE